MGKVNARLEYAYMLHEFGFTVFEKCSEEDNARYKEMQKNGEELPHNIVPNIDENGMKDGTYLIAEDDIMSFEEKQIYLNMKKVKHIKTIKNCVVFFTTITVISLICGALVAMLNII